MRHRHLSSLSSLAKCVHICKLIWYIEQCAWGSEVFWKWSLPTWLADKLLNVEQWQLVNLGTAVSHSGWPVDRQVSFLLWLHVEASAVNSSECCFLPSSLRPCSRWGWMWERALSQCSAPVCGELNTEIHILPSPPGTGNTTSTCASQCLERSLYGNTLELSTLPHAVLFIYVQN